MRTIQVAVVMTGVVVAVVVLLRGRERDAGTRDMDHRDAAARGGGADPAAAGPVSGRPARTASGAPDPENPTDRRPSAVAAEISDDRTHQFRPELGGYIRCLSCGDRVSADVMAAADGRYRVDGVADPDDKLLIVGMQCPTCRTSGSLHLGYGPDAAAEDADVLARLRPAGHDLDPVQGSSGAPPEGGGPQLG